MTPLSRHFNVEDLCVSRDYPDLALKALPEALDPEMLANGRRLAENILEPLLVLFPAGIEIHNGFRSHALNLAVGGSPTSQHCYFQAVDFLPLDPLGLGIPWAFAKTMEWGLESGRPKFRQLLSEAGNIHIGLAHGMAGDGMVGGWNSGQLSTWFKGLC